MENADLGFGIGLFVSIFFSAGAEVEQLNKKHRFTIFLKK